MKNKLTDLNDHLFAQLERLDNENLTPEELSKESERSKAICSVSGKILDNAKIHYDVLKLKAEYVGMDKDETIPMLQTMKPVPAIGSEK